MDNPQDRTDALKPCPFCAGAPLYQSHRIAEDAMLAFVYCQKCGTQTEHYEDAYAPKEQAIAAWNQRTGASEVVTDAVEINTSEAMPEDRFLAHIAGQLSAALIRFDAGHNRQDDAIELAEIVSEEWQWIKAALTAAPADATGAGARDDEWRCFHCGDVFAAEREARDHFGDHEGCTPACKIKAGGEKGLLEALRKSEREMQDAWSAVQSETIDVVKAMYGQSARHQTQLIAAEQAGYDKGLADGRALKDDAGESA